MDEKSSLLIVDDERGPAESLRMIFKPSYNVFMASGGHQALEIVHDNPIDVVTLDLRMPVMSGVEVMERIKRFDPDIEVIIVTGYSSLDSALHGIRYGVFDYVSKPFDVPQISDLVRRAAARRRLNLRNRRSKEDFLANLSHELRTPLSAIIGYSSILSDELQSVVTPDQHVALTRIQVNSGELLHLIEGVLLLNAIEAGEIDLNIQTFDVGQTVHRAIARFEGVARGKGLLLHTEISTPAPCAVSDEEKTERILWALLDNAVKFTRRGVVTVAVRSSSQLGSVEIEVRDTGIGMDSEELRCAIEGLAQADASPRRRYRGLGLGMRMATRLIQLLGGEIKVSSEANQGTRIVVTVPARSTLVTSSLH